MGEVVRNPVMFMEPRRPRRGRRAKKIAARSGAAMKDVR